MRAGIFTYAWDLDAEGHDVALGRISDTGFDAVNLATAYHAGKFLLPHNPRHRIYFPEDGAIYFRPDESRYGRIKPRVSSLVTGVTDPLRQLDSERRKHGLDLVSWVVCLHNTWLGERYPDCAIHNAFGDPYYHSLTPAHPDVIEYLVALLTDIVTAAEIKAVQLESPEYMGVEHGFHHEVIGVPLDDAQRVLLGLSFNPVDLERAGAAGIDGESLRSQVADTLDAIWTHGREEARDRVDALLGHPEFTAYLALRNEIVKDLLTRLYKAVHDASPDTEVRLFAGMGAGERNRDLERALVVNADGLLTGYMSSDEDARNRSRELRSLMGEKPVYGMVRAIAPDTIDPGQLAPRINAFKDGGVDGVDVYNYGFMTLPMLDAVGKALRN
jgi:hypothetical protein